MSLSNDMRLLAEIANMYYNEGAKQKDVAKKFNISRSLVSKYLTKARESGLVEIIIHDDQLHPHRHLEDKLKRKYDLLDVVCVSMPHPEQLKKKLGIAAAKYLSRTLKPNDVVGVSAGHGVFEAASNFSSTYRVNDITFVPLVGGHGATKSDVQASVVCKVFAEHSGGTALELHAPVAVDSTAAKKIFMEQSFIRRIFETAKLADVALVGIGAYTVYKEMTDLYTDGNSKEIAEKLEMDPALVAGDICYNFIDKNGNALDCYWNEVVLSVSLEDLKKIPTVIGVAGGSSKVKAVEAALRGKLIDVLITDENCAKQLL